MRVGVASGKNLLSWATSPPPRGARVQVGLKRRRTILCVHPRTGVCREKIKNAIPNVVWWLGFEMDIPIVRARDTLLQIPGARSRMEVRMAWENECREFKSQQFLRLCARDGIAIEQRLA